ncbi:hypothetical protein BC830DRAFT_177522 [Chytriomyces sp. MP71]|nr:hypothetical protein BC830DRAFT_177522 [Chytriomyces sp. MP71]
MFVFLAVVNLIFIHTPVGLYSRSLTGGSRSLRAIGAIAIAADWKCRRIGQVAQAVFPVLFGQFCFPFPFLYPG